MLFDYRAHNEQTAAVWDAFHRGEPIRTPVICGVSSRWAVLDRRVNHRRADFKTYTDDPRLMFEMQAEFDLFRRMHIPGDHMMGPPEEGLCVDVDFENYYEAAWLGAPVLYPKDNVPFAMPMLSDDERNLLFDRGIPDPFGGTMGLHRDYYEQFQSFARDYTLEGHKVAQIGCCGEWMDGPMTIACELRGADNFCIDLIEEPEYAQQLLRFLTEATIERVRAWRKYLGRPVMAKSFHFADDSAQMLSPKMYTELMLPHHRRLKEALSTGEERGGAHLCGDATHLFRIMRDELNAYTFDTGFPVDHVALARELGPEVCVQGGPPSMLIESGTPEQITAESRRILREVLPLTKRLVLRDGNDIPPNTPLQNIWALANAVQPE